MIDKKTFMMDAGTVLFETEKPFGTVLGGIKTELLKHGKVYRRNELDSAELPETTDDCDLFLDWSGKLRRRYISCLLEDDGVVGKTAEGEDVHRYAATFKEGNRNPLIRTAGGWILAAILVIAGIIGIPHVPRIITIIIGMAAGGYAAYQIVKPSVKSQKLVRELQSIMKEAK